MKLPENLSQKLAQRQHINALRQLSKPSKLVDFSSNDYIGFSKSVTIFNKTQQFLIDNNCIQNGATGSRLISGNHSLYEIAETQIAHFHESEAALLFNSGYDANIGFFSALPQRTDVILYDELCHASIRDGISLSKAKSYKYEHNDFEDLERLILKFKTTNSNIYVATESVFSMDGDCPNLEELVSLCEQNNVCLVVDEAHALGVFGEKGEGLLQSLQLQKRVFARIMTFGKGLGCHGAVVLGSQELQSYLINFARSFIYTTGLPPHSVATICTAYRQLAFEKSTIKKLRNNIIFFNQQKKLMSLQPMFVRSKSAIQSAIIPGNEKVKEVAQKMREQGFDVKAILSPTVPEGQERLRFCLHSYNSEEEITQILELLMQLIF